MTPDELLAQIKDWRVATGRSAAELGTIVLNAAGFVPLLAKRRSLRAATAEQICAFMAQFPDGESLPDPLVAFLSKIARAGRVWSPPAHEQIMRQYRWHTVEAALAAARSAPRPREPLTFEQQMAKVRAGARLVDKITFRRPDPDMTLGGVASGAL